MAFLKKFLLGFTALGLILMGGAGTQSSSSLMQGGGFIGLIIGLVVLYIFAKMAWRAMGCLPSFLIISGVLAFILYAIGAFNQGVHGVGPSIRSFLGQQSSGQQYNSLGVGGALTSENFSDPGRPAESSGGFFKKAEKSQNIEDFPIISSPARVISGDTLEIGGGYLTLYGIDAPEINQTCADKMGRSYNCGAKATAWLKSWIQNYALNCRIMKAYPNGSMQGTCLLGEYDLGAALVQNGWAVADTKQTDIYLPYQLEAQAKGQGLWQGEFYMPWDWVKAQNAKVKIKVIKEKPKRRSILDPI